MANRKNLIIIGVIAIVVFIVAFLIGYYSRSTKSCADKDGPKKGRMTKDEMDEMHKNIIKLVEPEELRKNMR